MRPHQHANRGIKEILISWTYPKYFLWAGTQLNALDVYDILGFEPPILDEKFYWGLEQSAEAAGTAVREMLKLPMDEQYSRKGNDKAKPIMRELTAERLLSELGEPPCKRLVDLEARNDECRARGFSPDELAPLGKLQRLFGYYGAAFGMQRLEDWKANKQRQQRTEQPELPSPSKG